MLRRRTIKRRAHHAGGQHESYVSTCLCGTLAFLVGPHRRRAAILFLWMMAFWLPLIIFTSQWTSSSIALNLQQVDRFYALQHVLVSLVGDNQTTTISLTDETTRNDHNIHHKLEWTTRRDAADFVQPTTNLSTITMTINNDNKSSNNDNQVTTTSLANDDKTKVFDHCFSLNSPAWLRGRRVGNSPIPDEWLDYVMQPHTVVQQPNIHTILNQTLCYPQGTFRNFSTTAAAAAAWNESDPTLLRAWEFRLLHLAIHRLMHVGAYPEYQRRRECANHQPFQSTTTSTTTSKHLLLNGNPGNFDYECPQSKFLVLTVNKGAGMGTILRNGIVPCFYLALATGRIPLLLQSVDNSTRKLRLLSQDFSLTSCPRRDWQCVFLPVSPCVLTMNDLRKATVLSKPTIKDLRRFGILPPVMDEARVLVLDLSLDPLLSTARVHEKIREQVYLAVTELLKDNQSHASSLSLSEGEKTQLKLWHKAAESFGVPYAGQSEEESAYRKERLNRAALMYLLRLNMRARHEVAQQVKTAMPLTSADRQYFGLPIRGTDKCRHESTCHSFDKYMQLMLLKKQQHGSQVKKGTILLTSDDPNLAALRLAYAKNNSFPLDFVVNEMDRPQGHGAPPDYVDADAVMMGSLAVMKLQMQANVLVLNCCSQFHSMLRDLVQEGCGADPELHWECLNEIDDPRFRICCGHTKQGVCQQIWENHRKDPANMELMSKPFY